MEDLTGKQLGKYQIISPLGQGGMATVYKAFQPGTERNVALKILPRHYAGEPEFLDRFKQEATIIAKFQHPHILPVFDYGEDDGYTYLVMPYIRSGTLSELMVGQPLALWRIRDIISQTGDALDYAHSYGVVHRDVKPSNILIDERDNCLLTDFGIAKIIGGTAQFTSIGHTIGTPAYMSPEQIDPGRIQNEDLDGRSDIYSLGIVLYELATGRTPYRAETPPALFVKHLYDPLPPPTKINPDLPEAIGNVILKALAKDREDRYETAGNMVRAVQEAIEVDLAEVTRSRMKDAAKTAAVIDPVALALGSAKPEPEAIPAELPAEPQQWFKRRTWLIAGAAIIAVAAIAIVLQIGGLLPEDSQANGEDTPAAEVIPTEIVAEVAAEPTKSATEVPVAQPTAEAQVIDPTPTAVDEDILEVVPVGGILFEDDFETGNVANWSYLGDGFEVVQDESGNRVLQLGPSASTDAELGDSSWRDYALEFRVKVLDPSDSGDVWIHPRHNQAHTTCTPYTIFFNIGDNQDSRIEREISTENGCESVVLDRAEDLNLETDRWYSLRVEVLGPQIGVYVDGQQVLQIENSEYPLAGPIRFSKSEDGLVYYDDLRVTRLPYAIASSSSYVEGRVLFEDDFESGEPGDWDSISEGAFVVIADEAGNQVLQMNSDTLAGMSVGNSGWSDYILEFRARFLGVAAGGVQEELLPFVRFARHLDGCEYYGFFILPGELTTGWLEKVCQGEAVEVESDSGLSFERNRWHTILIEAAGPRISVFLDGELILTWEDPNPVLTGAVSLSAIPGATVQFDDVRIVELLPEPTPADESLASFEETILFEDDFENGLADGWDYVPEGFEVVRDETGNSLLRATAANWGFARVQGADWQDYAVDFKVKLRDLGDQNLGRGMSVGIRDLVIFEGCSYYTIWTDMFYETGGLGREGDSGCDDLAMDTNQLLIIEAERWHSVRIEAVGGKISVFLDGTLILSGEDPAPILSGGIWIGIGPDTTTEYDDIRVTALVPDRPNKFIRMAIDSARKDPQAGFAVAALEGAIDSAPTYQDDFSDPLASKFIEEGDVTGRFTNGSYSIVTDPEMESYLDAGDGVSPNHSNIVLQSDIRLDPLLEGQARIFLRQSAEGQYEFVFYHADQEFFSQLSYGTPDSSIDLTPVDHGQDTGSWHNFVAVLIDNQVAYFLDGNLVLTDTRDGSSEGLFKTDAMPGTAFWIDNLRIWELDS